MKFLTIFFFWTLFLFTIFPFWQLYDFAKIGLLFTYFPRYILAILSILFFAYFFIKSKNYESLVCILLFIINLHFVGFNFDFSNESNSKLKCISFNIHNSVKGLSKFKNFCEKNDVEILILQEAKKKNRAIFTESLNNYRLFEMDENEEFEHRNYSPFSSIIGIKKSLIESKTCVETAITGYRTFALKLKIREQEFWIVNVHTTKAFFLDPKSGFSELIEKASYKASWHLKETELLNQWILEKGNSPILVSGDFNAPFYSSNLKLIGLQNAHFEAGNGFHLTFPRIFPIVGIDHTLGNSKIKFLDYKTVDFGFSDHKGQLFTFEILN